VKFRIHKRPPPPPMAPVDPEIQEGGENEVRIPEDVSAASTDTTEEAVAESVNRAKEVNSGKETEETEAL